MRRPKISKEKGEFEIQISPRVCHKYVIKIMDLGGVTLFTFVYVINMQIASGTPKKEKEMSRVYHVT